MNIALCHFRVGENDGVSLEMDKWKKALELNGHKVTYIAGSAGNSEAEIIPALHYQHQINNQIVKNAYGDLKDFASDKELQLQILNLASEIENDLIRIITKLNIEVIVPNNILSLGWGLSAGIAFTRAIKKMNIRAVCHHHDFHWERELYANPQFDFVKTLLNIYFPPKHERISHICINHIAQKELKRKYKINAKIIPNVFDFEENLMSVDDYNKDLRNELGIHPSDIVLLQATRVVERKAIELAIDFTKELEKLKSILIDKAIYNGNIFTKDSKIHLVLSGNNESSDYYNMLLTYAKNNKVEIINISDRIKHIRQTNENDKKYSLWDAYSIADIVTYPSILEGWGNQFLEAIAAKLPIVTYKYPAFISDIEKYKFNIITLGNNYIMENSLVKIDDQVLKDAANEAINYLLDEEFRAKNIEFNFDIARENLSIQSLRKMLKAVFEDGTN